jgi:hypothetical protein
VTGPADRPGAAAREREAEARIGRLGRMIERWRASGLSTEAAGAFLALLVSRRRRAPAQSEPLKGRRAPPT